MDIIMYTRSINAPGGARGQKENIIIIIENIKTWAMHVIIDKTRL